jgi:hypothetical protein
VTVLACATLAVLAAVLLSASARAGARPAAHIATLTVVADGLNQPKKITIGPGGSLIVAESGDGVSPAGCTNGNQPSCLDQSGSIDEISPAGQTRTLAPGLPSISSGTNAGVASGPAEARLIGGHLEVLFQDSGISDHTGAAPFGPGGAFLGDLVRLNGTAGRIQARFGQFEAAHNPDHGLGSMVVWHQESPIDSDPYSFVPYRGGYAVADAGGNDLLFVSRAGKISVLAVFPMISERAVAGTFGPGQKRPFVARAQAVPDSVAVGPDGALYVGELGGEPLDVGKSDVFRVVPGHVPTVYARGFTAIGDIAFDRSGRLLVLEIDHKGLNDPALKRGAPPASGEIIRVGAHRRQTVVASTGLEFATGIAVAPDGDVYASLNGIATATGEVVRVALR